MVIGGVDDVRISGMGRDVAVLAASDGLPFLDGDPAVVGSAGHRHRRVVLLRAVEPIWKLVVSGHVVELGGRLVEKRGPRLSAVEGDRRGATVALDHAERLSRV